MCTEPFNIVICLNKMDCLPMHPWHQHYMHCMVLKGLMCIKSLAQKQLESAHQKILSCGNFRRGVILAGKLGGQMEQLLRKEWQKFQHALHNTMTHLHCFVTIYFLAENVCKVSLLSQTEENYNCQVFIWNFEHAKWWFTPVRNAKYNNYKNVNKNSVKLARDLGAK